MGAIDDLSSDGLQVRADGELLWITMSESEKANALSPAMVAGLTRIYETDLRSEGFRAALLQAEEALLGRSRSEPPSIPARCWSGKEPPRLRAPAGAVRSGSSAEDADSGPGEGSLCRGGLWLGYRTRFRHRGR